MQQLDMMDIAGQKIGVKIAPMSAGETAQLAANAARLDLDDEGGFTGHLHSNFPPDLIHAMIAKILQRCGQLCFAQIIVHLLMDCKVTHFLAHPHPSFIFLAV